MGFHKRVIKKGIYGELSKIQEELEEAFDAEEQGQDLMLLIELSDMLGAIEGVSLKYGFTIEQLKEFARLRSQVAIEEEAEKHRNKKLKRQLDLEETQNIKRYKNFTMITTAYDCNKKCPYCIAKLDNIPEKREDLLAFEKAITVLKDKGCSFDYFVLSGNGEPSLYSYNVLNSIRDIVDSSGIFKEKRIQTSGFLFYDDEKLDMFKDWIIEITRVAIDFETDSKICRYSRDYLDTEGVKRARLRVNLVLLNNNIHNLVEVIKIYAEQPNVEIIALKILDNKENDWITANAIGYDKLDELVGYLTEKFGRPNKNFSNFIWNCEGKKITMFGNKDYLVKDLDSLYWYGDSFLNRG